MYANLKQENGLVDLEGCVPYADYQLEEQDINSHVLVRYVLV